MYVDDTFGPPIWMTFFMVVVFSLVVGTIFVGVIKGFTTWSSNNSSPVLIERARILSKRSKVYGGGESNANTAYFVTFELEANSDRIELQVSGRETGLLVEGDIGDLTFQGSRYKGFERKK